MTEGTFWIIFVAAVAVMFYIDLYATEHRHRKLTIKSSLVWSGVWIGAALLFNLLILIFLEDGKIKAAEFLAGYLIEKSLSVDNLFVFIMIFEIMDVSPENQPHVLKWGILSAIVLRIIFILLGVAVINLFHPVIFLFGIILLYAAWKMAFGKNKKIDYDSNIFIKFFKRRFRIVSDYKGRDFFVRRNGGIFLTPVFLTLVLVESADIVFAVDSIPAVIAITRDPFIIITSNIFAILGLRALYFALSGVVELFIYLRYGVALILAYVGIKMLISDLYHIPTIYSLIFILGSLTVSVVLSLVYSSGRSGPKHTG